MSQRLHPDQVLELRRRHAAGYTIKSLSDAFGLSRTTVSRVVNGHTHKRVVETDMPPLVKVEPLPPRPPVKALSPPPEELKGGFAAMAANLRAGRP